MNEKSEEFSKADIKFCDSIASQILHIDENSLWFNRQIFDQYFCIYYSEPGEEGRGILVCRDGSFLVCNSVPFHLQIEAFKSGFRSTQDLITC
jgi:hypothetical protein